jgi:hypothetical protein
MLTNSTRDDLMRWFAAVALTICWMPVSAAVDATIGTDGQLSLDPHHARAFVQKAGQVQRHLHIESPLARELSEAQTAFAVGERSFQEGGATWLLIVTESESRSNHAAGACGSGTEDLLHLVHVDLSKARLVEHSHLVLQSCLTGLSLNNDSGRSLQDLLESVPDPSRLRLKWLNHPDYGDQQRTLSVVNGALKVD